MTTETPKTDTPKSGDEKVLMQQQPERGLPYTLMNYPFEKRTDGTNSQSKSDF